LNKQGASDLVVELFMSGSPINILEESVNLAIALLEGGNTEVQVILHFKKIIKKKNKIFFRQVFFVIYMDVNQHQKNFLKFFMINYILHKKH